MVRFITLISLSYISLVRGFQRIHALHTNRSTKMSTFSKSLNDSLSNCNYIITVFSRPGCKYCRIAKATLSNLGLNYKDIDISLENLNFNEILLNSSISEETFSQRLQYAKQRTVPQIYVGMDHIGGCDDLIKQIDNNSFSDILNKWNISATVTPSTDLLLSPSDTINTTNDRQNKSIKLSYLNENIHSRTIKATSSSKNTSYTPLELSKLLQTSILQLSDQFISKDGKKVNYKAMKTSKAFEEYVSLTHLLNEYSVEELSHQLKNQNMRLSFFINIYNSMIIHATCVLGASENSPNGRSDFFKGKTGALYNIAGHLFSPDDIEHGIIRANTAHPSQQMQGLSFYFQDSEDPRKILSMSPPLDPRIHFILNCGASSCPPIAILGDEPDQALQLAAQAYLENEIKLNTKIRVLYLPKLLLWYGQDFGKNLNERLKCILHMMDIQNEFYQSFINDLKTLGWDLNNSMTLSDDELPFTVEYNNYDWTSNEYI